MSAVDDFYLKQDEPTRGTFLALRDIILKHNLEITNELKYGLLIDQNKDLPLKKINSLLSKALNYY